MMRMNFLLADPSRSEDVEGDEKEEYELTDETETSLGSLPPQQDLVGTRDRALATEPCSSVVNAAYNWSMNGRSNHGSNSSQTTESHTAPGNIVSHVRGPSELFNSVNVAGSKVENWKANSQRCSSSSSSSSSSPGGSGAGSGGSRGKVVRNGQLVLALSDAGREDLSTPSAGQVLSSDARSFSALSHLSLMALDRSSQLPLHLQQQQVKRRRGRPTPKGLGVGGTDVLPPPRKNKPYDRSPTRSTSSSSRASRRNNNCSYPECVKIARGSTGLCVRHGGGKRCAFPVEPPAGPCCRVAQGRSIFCKAHGGGSRCEHEGCDKSARGTTRFCVGHGGGVRCQVEGCITGARGKMGLCAKHGSQSSQSSSSSQDQSQSSNSSNSSSGPSSPPPLSGHHILEQLLSTASNGVDLLSRSAQLLGMVTNDDDSPMSTSSSLSDNR